MMTVKGEESHIDTRSEICISTDLCCCRSVWLPICVAADLCLPICRHVRGRVNHSIIFPGSFKNFRDKLSAVMQTLLKWSSRPLECVNALPRNIKSVYLRLHEYRELHEVSLKICVVSFLRRLHCHLSMNMRSNLKNNEFNTTYFMGWTLLIIKSINMRRN